MALRPSPLLPLTNAALALHARDKDPQRAWNALAKTCMDQHGLVPTGPCAVALKRLLEAYAADPDLSPMGWYSAQHVQVGPRLRNLALVQTQIQAQPDIALENVADVVVVAGLPRTATTVAHQMLAAAAGHRGTLMAEMYETRTRYPDWEAQVARAQRQITMLGRYEPWFTRDIHPMDATASEETFFCEVASVFFMCSAALPGYRAWLAAQDPTPYYQWIKQVLQVLQYGKARRRWVIKQPAHLWHLDTIRKVFPRATIVWTHRDPATVFGSACSMIEAMRRMHLRRAAFNRDGLQHLGGTWLSLLAEGVERARTARAALPGDAVVDVAYHRLVQNPAAEMQALFHRLDMDWTPEDAARVDQHFHRRPARRPHEYSPLRYLEHPAQIDDAFGDYPQLVHRLNAGATL